MSTTTVEPVNDGIAYRLVAAYRSFQGLTRYRSQTCRRTKCQVRPICPVVGRLGRGRRHGCRVRFNAPGSTRIAVRRTQARRGRWRADLARFTFWVGYGRLRCRTRIGNRNRSPQRGYIDQPVRTSDAIVPALQPILGHCLYCFHCEAGEAGNLGRCLQLQTTFLGHAGAGLHDRLGQCRGKLLQRHCRRH